MFRMKDHGYAKICLVMYTLSITMLIKMIIVCMLIRKVAESETSPLTSGIGGHVHGQPVAPGTVERWKWCGHALVA